MAEEFDEKEEMEYDELMELLDQHPALRERLYREQFEGYKSHYRKVMCPPPSRNIYIQMKTGFLNESNESKKQLVLKRGEVLQVIGLMPHTYDVVVQSKVDHCCYALGMGMFDYVPKPEPWRRRPRGRE